MSMIIKEGNVIEWSDLTAVERVSQRGMYYGIGSDYSVILMSRNNNAPYKDTAYDDESTIEYEGHDAPNDRDKKLDQPLTTPRGGYTENGKFAMAVARYKRTNKPEKVKVYEKLTPNYWHYKGIYYLVDVKRINDGRRNVFHFILTHDI